MPLTLIPGGLEEFERTIRPFLFFYIPWKRFWKAYSNTERTTAIPSIEKIVNHFGFITDFKQFSDTSLSIKIELEESKIDNLYYALKTCVTLNHVDQLNSTSNVERAIFLNITFTKGTGNLRIETPAVPG